MCVCSHHIMFLYYLTSRFDVSIITGRSTYALEATFGVNAIGTNWLRILQKKKPHVSVIKLKKKEADIQLGFRKTVTVPLLKFHLETYSREHDDGVIQ